MEGMATTAGNYGGPAAGAASSTVRQQQQQQSHAPLTGYPSAGQAGGNGGFTSFHPSAGGPGPGSAAMQLKRSTSPVKQPNGGGPARPRPGGTESLLNIRAEEEAARRLNAGRVYTGGGGPRGGDNGRYSDLFGRNYLRERTTRLTRDYGVSLDDEALTYLSQAAEQRIRALLTSSVRAQAHRTQTSHHRPPPLTSGSSTTPAALAEDDESARPMWSHVVTSDVNAVMDALTRRSKEEELGFRAARMERIVKEGEMARLREMREARARENGLMPGGQEAVAGPSGAQGEGMEVDESGLSSDPPSATDPNFPSTPRDKASPSTPATATPAPSGPPVFGAPRVITGKKSKKGKEVSAETAHKMSNMTAIRATGQKMGKYAWLNNTPNVSSPLAGRKKKEPVPASGLKKDADGEADADGEVDDGAEEGGAGTKRAREADGGEGGPIPPDAARKKSKLSQSITVDQNSTPSKPPKKKHRPKITVPARRLVPVHPLPSSNPHTPAPVPAQTPINEFTGTGGAAGASTPKDDRRMVPDDQALTAVDVMFALEREGTGRGMGTAEEIIWKFQGRPGGIWGKDSGDAPAGQAAKR